MSAYVPGGSAIVTLADPDQYSRYRTANLSTTLSARLGDLTHDQARSSMYRQPFPSVDGQPPSEEIASGFERQGATHFFIPPAPLPPDEPTRSGSTGGMIPASLASVPAALHNLDLNAHDTHTVNWTVNNTYYTEVLQYGRCVSFGSRAREITSVMTRDVAGQSARTHVFAEHTHPHSNPEGHTYAEKDRPVFSYGIGEDGLPVFTPEVPYDERLFESLEWHISTLESIPNHEEFLVRMLRGQLEWTPLIRDVTEHFFTKAKAKVKVGRNKRAGAHMQEVETALSGKWTWIQLVPFGDRTRTQYVNNVGYLCWALYDARAFFRGRQLRSDFDIVSFVAETIAYICSRYNAME
jgi:hypothetical protein